MFGMKTIGSMIQNLNQTIANSVIVTNKALTATDKAITAGEAAHKTVVTTAGGLGFVKGAVDIAEDLVCQDYICLTVDCIGVAADILTCATSFVPGLNVTSVLTIPVSSSCKFLRWCCTKSFLKIGCRR